MCAVFYFLLCSTLIHVSASGSVCCIHRLTCLLLQFVLVVAGTLLALFRLLFAETKWCTAAMLLFASVHPFLNAAILNARVIVKARPANTCCARDRSNASLLIVSLRIYLHQRKWQHFFSLVP